MIHSKIHSAYSLQTARLCLLPIERSDLDTLHQLVIHPEVRRFLCDGQILAKEQISDWIEASLSLFETNHFGLWVAVPKTEQDHATQDSYTKELIGFCGFWYFHTPPELELLFCIAPEYWNRGFATEAAQALMDYGFDQLKFDRIAASADVPNAASIRVMQKLGMTEVKRVIHNGSELVHYSIAQEEIR